MKICKDLYFLRFDRIVTLCFQDVTKIVDAVVDLFKKLIVRRPLGVFLDNAMEQYLIKNAIINFTIPMVNLDKINQN